MAQALVAPRAVRLRNKASAYFALTKPSIIELLLVTTLPAMFLAAGGLPPLGLVAATLVGGTISAGAANALNMVLDRDLDKLMERTSRRPLPAGIVTPFAATGFGLVLAVVGAMWLWLTVGWLAAAITAGGLLFYVAVYTAVLKRRTVQNIVIGGAAGAVPALVGWAAVTGRVSTPAWVLFAVVFLWTPPHFWALAVLCERDYRNAKVPMLPVVRGAPAAARSGFRYAVATVVASSVLPFVHPTLGWIYIVSASCFGALFVCRALQFRNDPGPGTARALFAYSIVYLAVLSAAIVLDQLTPSTGF